MGEVERYAGCEARAWAKYRPTNPEPVTKEEIETWARIMWEHHKHMLSHRGLYKIVRERFIEAYIKAAVEALL
jgi:hypothetical protein